MSRARLAASLAIGALVVHEGRYLIGYGHDAQRVMAEQGHGYLSLAAALAGGLAVVACVALVMGLARGGARIGWARAGLALSAIYTLQELAEGALAGGHPAGIGGVVGGAGWTAFLLAFACGALIAWLERRAERFEPWAPAARLAATFALPRSTAAPRMPRLARPAPLALCAPGRAPPQAS